ncbi:SET domain and mariner transposase fusion protein [Geranomyces variabilis]|nr:SET domain and mariner transposase fusion protein [Geranomyces variabilis]KAJ3134054.1 hypothetical protein HDU90_005402 [Geranomyces variabilis]
MAQHAPPPIEYESPELASAILGSFEYVDGNIFLKHPSPFYDGCDCVEACASATCGCAYAHGTAYTSDSLLIPTRPDVPIYECNSRCSCDSSCANRVVQHGVRVRLQVFRSGPKGFGLRTLEKIQKGHFVAEYSGEIISATEASKRWQERRKLGLSNYILRLREHSIQNGRVYRTTIDPTHRGSVARFINHSCEPCLEMFTVRVDQFVPSAALFAKRDIEVGEELTFDYGGGVAAADAEEESASDALVQEAGSVHADDDAARIPCACGAASCRGYLPYDPSL